MWCRWILTVPSLMLSLSATSLLRRPPAIMRVMAISRGVSVRPASRAPASRRSILSSARPKDRRSIHCSPACTFLTHWTSMCGAISFSTMPRTPRRIASTTASSSTSAVRSTTRTGNCSFRTSRSTARPSRPGMRMSRIRRSGWCSRAARRASSPSRHRATTVKSGSAWKSRSSPSRTRGWSSAMTRRMGTVSSRWKPGAAGWTAATRPRRNPRRASRAGR